MKSFSTTITCPLPARIERAGKWWEIRIAPDGKTRDCVSVKRMEDGELFSITSGRRGTVRAQNLSSNPGTIRHELFLILAATGRARMTEDSDGETSF